MSTSYRNRLGDTLISDYIKLFSSYSFKNNLYAQVSLHVLLGQAVSRPTYEYDSDGREVVKKIPVYYQMGSRRLDTRVHMLLIKPQGTGKGAGFGFVERMARELGLDFQPLTESTDAGLVGTLDRDEDGNTIVVDGLLRTADIIGMEEASVLFDLTSDFSKKNMTYMQITMNPLDDASCFISKKLGSHLIEFKPHASFLLLTYPPDKLVDKLLKTGFMDRIICIFEDVTLEDRLNVIQMMSEHINKMTRKESDIEFESVKNRLRTVIKYWTETNVATRVTVPESVHNNLVNVINEFAVKILDASPKAREKLEHFVSRLYEVLLKLAIHHALLNLRSTLDVSDVIYARLLYLPIWRNLIISVESLLIISDIERHRRHMIIRHALDEYDRIVAEGKFPHVRDKVWVRRLTMIENLQPKWDNCSKETADNHLRKLEKVVSKDDKKKSRLDILRARMEKDKFFEVKMINDFAYVRKIKDIRK